MDVYIRRNRFDTCASSTCNNTDASCRSNRSFARKPFCAANILRVGASAPLIGQFNRRMIYTFLDMVEELEVPCLCHDALKGNALGLQEAVEAHDSQAYAAFPHGTVA